MGFAMYDITRFSSLCVNRCGKGLGVGLSRY